MNRTPLHVTFFSEVPLYCDDPVNQNFLLQQFGERIEKLSQRDRLSKFCLDAGFLHVLENGQYFMTKDTAEFSQFQYSGLSRLPASKR